MPTLNWIGKDAIITHHNKVPFHVLRHKYGFTAENGVQAEETESGNMIIHGDNLIVLKSLLPRYEGKIDCIYIDPPYNTGNKTWVYNDNVNDPRLLRWLGKEVKSELEDLSRHDKWLCMMYPRLELLRQLLSPNGAIFVSIDDVEVSHLRVIMDSIFGINCFVGDIIWQKTYSPRNDADGIPSEVDHTLVYSKRPGWQPKALERTTEMDSKYKNPDNDFTLWTSSDAFAPDSIAHQGMVYGVQQPITGEIIYPPSGRHWAFEQDAILESLKGWCEYELRDLDDAERRAAVCGIPVEEVREGVKGIVLKESLEVSREKAQAVYDRGQWPKFYFTSKGKGGIRRKTYLTNVEGRKTTNLWHYDEVGHTDEATKELKEIFGGQSPFDTPKPTRLIERILQIATDENSIILDSYAGSATTMHAAMNLNRKDRGNRRVILIELEDYADNITAERMRRVIGGYVYKGKKKEVLYEKKLTVTALKKMDKWLAEGEQIAELNQDKYDKIERELKENVYHIIGTKQYDEQMPGIGGAFDFYEMGEPLFREKDLLNENVGEDRLREYVFYTETHQPIEERDASQSRYLLGRFDTTDYYFYYEPDSLTSLSIDTLGIVSRKAERYIIYADVCLLSPEQLAAMHIVFKKIPRDIKRF